MGAAKRNSEVSVSSKAGCATPAQLRLKAASLSSGRLLKSCHAVTSNTQLMCLVLGYQPFTLCTQFYFTVRARKAAAETAAITAARAGGGVTSLQRGAMACGSQVTTDNFGLFLPGIKVMFWLRADTDTSV